LQAYHSIFLDEADLPVIGMPPHPEHRTRNTSLQTAISKHVTDVAFVGNFPLLPLRTRTRGPAYVLPALPPSESDLDIDPNSESYDCIDEILSLFRANVLFRNFEIKGPADRTLIYGILFLSECLGKVKPGMAARDAEKVDTSLSEGALGWEC
jgi:actin related protein 2/3 complex, subunit 3